MDREKLSHVITLPHIPDARAREENLKYCHVCLERTKLTREHIPPEKAFNEHNQLWERLVINSKPMSTRKVYIRGGFWVPTLCSKCNNEIGAQYAREYVKFVRDLVASPALFDSSGVARLVSINADTLFIAKEIAIMILAFEPISFARRHTELRKFVLHKDRCFIPPFRILSFLVPEVEEAGTITRFHGRVETFAPGYKFYGGEISCFPFGFVYATDIGRGYEIEQMTDITHWFNEKQTDVRAESFFSRITGVDSMQCILGHGRVRPQIDYI